MKQGKRILAAIGVYIGIYLVCSVLFVAMFHTKLFAGMDVLMYRGTMFIILCGILAALLMFGASKLFHKLKLDAKDILLMFCGFCCVNMVLFTLIPVTVERSVSVFMLSYMEENQEQAFTEEEIRDQFIDIYVDEFGAFDKRFHEQIISGNIKYNEEKDGYELTNSGKTVVKLFRLVATWFDTDQRLVHPTAEGMEE